MMKIIHIIVVVSNATTVPTKEAVVVVVIVVIVNKSDYFYRKVMCGYKVKRKQIISNSPNSSLSIFDPMHFYIQLIAFLALQF